MASESDRIARAGDYVLGLMNDRDRQRAERDLEIDPAFRDQCCNTPNACTSSTITPEPAGRRRALAP